jgi:general stress protein YciG
VFARTKFVYARRATVAKEDRGFASMDRNKQREIASKGGKAAHQKGTAHEWTSEEAREAGRKGGMASHRRKQQQGGGDQSGNAGGGSTQASASDEMMR